MSMSAIDKLKEEEEDTFDAFYNGVLRVLESMDDPEEVEEAIKDKGYEEALEHIDMDQEEYEFNTDILRALARKISEDNPELMAQLADELGDEQVDV